MRQTWGKLAFFHWTVPAAEVDRLLPEGIELDLFGDQAWVSVVPFSCRLRCCPRSPDC